MYSHEAQVSELDMTQFSPNKKIKGSGDQSQ